MNHIIAHVDMDCFFVACEEKKNPKLKGKPVMVGATGNRGVVSAANYEARRYGVFSATPITKARRLCPEGIFLRGDYHYYRKESKRIMHFLRLFADDFQQVSVDEAYLEVTSFSEQFSTVEEMGNFLQRLIVSQTGLSCSIGISESRTIAKIASDYKKPAGVTVVHDIQKFLGPLPIEKYPGVGKKSLPRYHRYGIHTFSDLFTKNRFFMMDHFGKYGVVLQKIALGEYITTIRHRDKAKSISRERTFFSDVVNHHELLHSFDRIAAKLYDDLGDRTFKTLSIKVRFSDFTTITRDLTLHTPLQAQENIAFYAKKLFLKSVVTSSKIRLLGIRLTKLEDNGGQKMLTDYLGNSSVGISVTQ